MHINKKLKVVLSSEDIKQRGIKLASFEDSLEQELEKKQESTKVFNDKIKDIRGQISSVSREVNDGFVVIKVECEQVINDVTGKVVVTRIDTGEIVEERAMTEEERQRPMF